MLRSDFILLLKKIDKRFCCKSPYPGFVGLVLERPAKWEKVGLDLVDFSSNVANDIREYNAGIKDEIICGLASSYLPEYTKFNYTTRLPVLRGYKDIIHILVKKKLVSIEKADKYFSYDKNYNWFNMNDIEKANFVLYDKRE